MLRKSLLVIVIALLGIGASKAQNPVLVNGTPAEHFINEEFCFPLFIDNAGPNPGYGPYIRLILPPGVVFNSATFLGQPVTTTVVGTFGALPLKDPVLNTGTAVDSVSGPVGHTLIILQFPVGSLTTGGITLETEVCLLMDPVQINVGDPQVIDATPVYEFGDTPTGANGPIVGNSVQNTVIPTLYEYEKRNDAPKENRTPGPSWPITYTLDVDIANAMTITNLHFEDTLPGILQWTGAPVVVTGGVGCVVVSSPNPPPTPGGTIEVNCASATGILGGGDLTVEYQAYVIDTLDETIGDGGSCDIDTVINQSSFDATEDTLALGNDTVIAYNVTMQHGANPFLNSPGATVTYSVNYQVSDYITAADSFVITVVTGDGLDYIGNATLNGSPITPASVLLNTPSVGRTTVTFFAVSAIGPIGPGSSGTLTYECLVRQDYPSTGDPVLTRDIIANDATVDYHLTDEAPGINGCTYSCQTSILIIPSSLTKTVVGPAVYDPGDLVTYRLRMDIPSGDADGVVVTDFFPLPIHDVNDLNLTWNGSDIVQTAAHNVPNIPTISTDVSRNALILDFGDIATTTPPSTIELEVTIPITTIPYADGLFHSNFIQGETNNSSIDGLLDVTLTLIQVNAPVLEITKGVSNVSNPNATVAPASGFPVDGNASDADGADTVTFVVTLQNTGNATAYDVEIADPVPVGYDNCFIQSVTRGDGSSFPFTPSGTLFSSPNDTLFLDSLEAVGAASTGDIALLTYGCVVDPMVEFDRDIPNTAGAIWTSEPGQAVSFPVVEDDAEVTVAVPAVSKSVIDILPGNTGSLGTAHVGELIRYRVEMEIPEGQVDNVRIVDLLDAGLAFVSLDTLFASAMVSSNLGSFATIQGNVVFSSSGSGGTAPDRMMEVDLGTLRNSDVVDTTLETLVLEYTVRVLNSNGNVQGQNLNNRVDFEWDDPNGGGRINVGANGPNVQVVEADLELTKSFLTNNVQRGDEVFVTLEFNHTGSSGATAYDVEVTDTLPLGLNFVPNSFTSACGLSFSSGPSINGQLVRATLDSLPLGVTCSITFKVEVDNAIPECDTITNCGDIFWQSLYSGNQAGLPLPPNNGLGYERTGDTTSPGELHDYAFEGCAGLNIINGLATDPVITSNSPVCVGGNAVLQVQQYTGQVVTYEWFGPGGTPLGNNSFELVLSPVALADSGSYTVVVTVDGCVSDTSQAHILAIVPGPSLNPTNNGMICSANGTDLLLFSNVSGGTPPYTFSWTGPNGFSANTADPVIPNVQASASGYYSVQVTDSNGCASTSASTLVEVTTQPNLPIISLNSPLCEGGSVTVSTSGYSGSVVSYDWIGPGVPPNTTGNGFSISPVTVADAGSYQVVVTVDGCASDTSSASVLVVNPLPALPNPTANSPLCEGDSLLLIANPPAGGPFTYAWSGPNGFVSTQENPVAANANGAMAGSYLLEITSTAGCANAAAVQLAVNPQPATPVITGGGTYCEGQNAVLGTNPYTGTVVQYIWTLPNGSFDTTASPQLPFNPVTSADSGTYQLQVILDGCASNPSASVLLDVQTAPVLAASGSGTFCEGESATLMAAVTPAGNHAYAWTGPSGYVSNQQNPLISNLTAANQGIYTVEVSVGLCTVTDTVEIIVNPAPAAPGIFGASSICDGDSLVLSTTAIAASYTWTAPNGNTLSGGPVLTVLPSDAEYLGGDWTLVIADANTCSSASSAPHTVVIHPVPTALPSNDGPICFNGTVNLMGNNVSGGDYAWYDGDPNMGGNLISTNQNTSVGPLSTGNFDYYLVVTVNGCPSLPVATTVVVDSLLSAPQVPSDFDVCEGEAIVLGTTTAADSYQWTGPNGFSSASANPAAISPATALDAGDYVLSVTVGGCGSASDTVSVGVNPQPATPSLTANGPLCAGDTLELQTSASCGGYEWIGPGGNSATTLNNPLLNTATNNTSIPPTDSAYLAGQWSVVCVSDSGCASQPSAAVPVDIHPVPTALPSNDGPICFNGTVNLMGNNVSGGDYAWYDGGPNMGGNLISTNQNTSVGPLSTGNFDYYLVVTVNGCPSLPVATTVVVDSLLSAPQLPSDFNVCEGEAIVLGTTTAADSYQWTGPNGFSSASANPAAISPATALDAGDYVLSVTVGGCGSASDTVSVGVNPQPATPTLTANGPLCAGDTLELQTSASCGGYEWIGPGGNSATTLNNPLLNTATNNTSIPPTDSAYLAGQWSVVCVSDSGCASQPSAAVTVDILPVPTALPSNDGPICFNGTVNLMGNNVSGGDYAWYDGDPNMGGNLISTNQNTSVGPLSTGNFDYYLVVTVNGCPSLPVATTVVVDSLLSAPQVPSDFNVCEGDAIVLGTTTAADSYQWTGPNGFSSASANPAAISPATALDAGDYVLSVTVGGCGSASDTVSVGVNPQPATPGLTANGPLCAGDTLELQTSASCGGYEWIGPGGNSSTTLNNPLLNTATNITSIPPTDSAYLAGQWSVVCVSDSGCASQPSAAVTVDIHPVPTAPSAANNGPVCEGGSLQLTASSTSGASYMWTGPNGFFSSAQNPVITYANSAQHAGNYQVVVEVNGCVSLPSAPTTVVVNSAPLVSVTNDTLLCSYGNTDIILNAVVTGGSGGYVHNWTGPNGFFSTSPNPIVPNATSSDAGPYTLTVIDTAGCASSPATLTLHITDGISTPVITPVGPLCEGDQLQLTATPYAGDTVEYFWTTPNGTVQTVNASLIINASSLSDSGTYSVFVVVDGCNSQPSNAINVQIEPNPVAPNPTAVYGAANNCAGDSLSLGATGNPSHNYAWTGPNGFAATGQTVVVPQADPSYNGTYTVVVTNGNCSSTGSVTLNSILPYPAVPLLTSNADTICEGGGFQLNSSSYSGTTVVYTWSTPTGPQTTNVPSLTVAPLTVADSGTYSIIVTVDGCASLSSNAVELVVEESPVAPNPTAVYGAANNCAGDSLSLGATGDPSHNYAWTGPNGFAATGQTVVVPQADPSYNGTYTVVVTNGNCSSTGSVTLNSILPYPAVPLLTSNADTICEGGGLQLNSSSYSGTTVVYTWSTPTGPQTTNVPSLTVAPLTVADSGTYSIIVTVDGCASLSSNAVELVVEESPVAPNPTAVYGAANNCAGDSLSLGAVGNPSHNYAWTGPNGFAATGQAVVIPQADPSYNGTYTVVVTNGNCSSTGSVTLNSILPYPAVPLLTSNADTICEGGGFQLTSSSYSGTTVVYTWSTPTGPQTTNVPSLTVAPLTVADSGTYSIIVTVDGCASLSSNAVELVVEESPVAPNPTAVYGAANNCAGDSLFLFAAGDPSHAYFWSGPNGFSSTNQNPVIPNADASSNGTYTVTVVNGNCSANGAVGVSSITPYPITPVLVGGGAFCVGDLLQLNANNYSGSVSYLWNTPTGVDTTNFSTYTNGNLSQVDSGAYGLVVVVNGCASAPSNQVQVVVHPIPSAPTIVNNGNVFCEGDTLTFSSSSPSSGHIWSGPNGFNSTLPSPPAIGPLSLSDAGVYSLRVELNGCTSAVAVDTIVVNPSPAQPTIAGASSICDGEDLVLGTSASCGQYLWIGPGGSSAGTLSNPYLNTTNNVTSIPASDSSYAGGDWSVVCVGANGCASESSLPVNVVITPLPAAPSATNNGPLCVGDDGQLFANGPSGASYVWSGPNGFTSNAQSPTLYNVDSADSGAYAVQVAINGCLSDTTFTNLVVHPLPPVPAPSSNSPVCGGFQIELYANVTASAYHWTGPNGFASNQQNPILTGAGPVNAGTYFLTVEENGCLSGTGVATVTVFNSVNPPTLTSNAPLCEGEVLALNSSSYPGPGISYVWYGPGGAVLDTTTIPQYIDSSAAVSDAGFYQVAVIISGCGTLPSAFEQVVVHPIPAAPPIISNSPVCEGSELVLATSVQADAYLWTGPDGYVSTLQQPDVIMNAELVDSGTYYLTVTVNGCVSPTDSAFVTVHPTPSEPSINTNSPVCIGDSLVIFTNFSGSSAYNWTFPNGGTLTTADTFIVVYPVTTNDAGFYHVTHTANGCTSDPSAPIAVTVNDVPPENAFAGVDVLVCVPSLPVQLEAENNLPGFWTTNSNAVIISPSDANSLVTNLEAGTDYTFFWTVNNGACNLVSIDSVVVSVAQGPVALDDSMDLVAGETVENYYPAENDSLYGLDGQSILVEGAGFGEVEIDEDGFATYTSGASYYGMDEFDYQLCLAACPDLCDTATVWITVNPLLVIPDLITPNGDETNDAFVMLGIENYPDNELFIYNRWGNEVYHAQPYQNDWKGTWKGEPLPDATYFYVLMDVVTGDVIAKGYITLHR